MGNILKVLSNSIYYDVSSNVTDINVQTFIFTLFNVFLTVLLTFFDTTHRCNVSFFTLTNPKSSQSCHTNTILPMMNRERMNKM